MAILPLINWRDFLADYRPPKTLHQASTIPCTAFRTCFNVFGYLSRLWSPLRDPPDALLRLNFTLTDDSMPPGLGDRSTGKCKSRLGRKTPRSSSIVCHRPLSPTNRYSLMPFCSILASTPVLALRDTCCKAPVTLIVVFLCCDCVRECRISRRIVFGVEISNFFVELATVSWLIITETSFYRISKCKVCFLHVLLWLVTRISLQCLRLYYGVC